MKATMRATGERRTVTGIETMFDARKAPWDGLGKNVSGALSSEEAIKAAGLDWNVIQKPVETVDGIPIPGFKANMRDTDNGFLGIITDRYKIVQNREAFSFTDSLLGEGVKYETAGSINNGRRVWMLAKLEGRLITDEKVDPYLVFTNSHDGTGSIRVAITPIRVWCQNTLNLALKQASRQWSCIHKGNIDEKMNEARLTLMNAEKYLGRLESEIGALKLQKMTDDQVMKFIEQLFPIDKAETSTTKINNIKAKRVALEQIYFTAPDLEVVEKSKFRLINAISDYATHSRPGRLTKNYQENMFLKTVDGNPLIDKAYAMIAAV